jgi:hypothetical protein
MATNPEISMGRCRYGHEYVYALRIFLPPLTLAERWKMPEIELGYNTMAWYMRPYETNTGTAFLFCPDDDSQAGGIALLGAITRLLGLKPMPPVILSVQVPMLESHISCRRQ